MIRRMSWIELILLTLLSIRSLTVIPHVTYPIRCKRWKKEFNLLIWSADGNPPPDRQVEQKKNA